MKLLPKDPPRLFTAGGVSLRDCGRLELSADEQVTLVTEAGAEYDVARKDWGFYATPSINGRLLRFGLRAALARNADGKLFLLLVEKGREAAFEAYLTGQKMSVERWLADDASIRTCLCGGSALEPAFSYDAPPAGETKFPIPGAYRRRYLRCRSCGHYLSDHQMDLSALYSGQYVDSTYGDGMAKTFEKIVGLPEGKSDNAARVRRIDEFARKRFGPEGGKGRSILDIGSGLCVFLHRMKASGWVGTALDPDARAAAHARALAGVEAVQGDFMKGARLGRYDAVSFNKVLEHVLDPAAMLARARAHVQDHGFVYVELPDGEAAAAEGPGREEFFIEHHHVFSPASLAVLAQRAGFSLAELERLREPSGKYTLRAFLVP